MMAYSGWEFVGLLESLDGWICDVEGEAKLWNKEGGEEKQWAW
jgi:hypothetical protein